MDRDVDEVLEEWSRRRQVLQAIATDEWSGLTIHLVGCLVKVGQDWAVVRPELLFLAIPVELMETADEVGATEYHHGGRRIGLLHDGCMVMVSDFDPEAVPGEHGPC